MGARAANRSIGNDAKREHADNGDRSETIAEAALWGLQTHESQACILQATSPL